MNVWSNLPNAKLIDHVLADSGRRSGAWGRAWLYMQDIDPVNPMPSRPVAWEIIRASHLRLEASEVLRLCVGPTWDACLALIAWPEESAALLDMPADAVRLLATSGHHPARLLLPACIAMNGDTSESAGPTT